MPLILNTFFSPPFKNVPSFQRVTGTTQISDKAEQHLSVLISDLSLG